MNLKIDKKILIVGLGLIGGSYAQALSSKGYNVCAIDISQESIDYAIQKNWITQGSTQLEQEFISQFDIVIFGLYPHDLIDWVERNSKYLKKGALLTDVTGVKGSIVYRVQEILGDNVEFIGAHPMAGSEFSGVKNSRMEIFQNANYIVTPTERNTQCAIDTCKELGHILGFKTITELSPQEHDEMIAFLSQLTHCIAITLMTCRDTECMTDYSGDSFRDLTRIAKINDEMWSELFLLNKDDLLKQMKLFEQAFSKLYTYIENDNREEIRKIMRYSTSQRELFDKTREK
ncbi:MAG: prephenate dehydrogenase [Clostridia bacterium]|nr:prephenate dehydrogenase [Clostridia bacterium]